MIKLLMKSGEETREVEFNGGPITIGRSADNTLTLPDKKASRKHARIEKVGEEYLITDLESGNGTKVNGQDVSGTRVLVKGDEIKIGFSSLFVLTLDTPAPAAPLPLPVAVPVAAAPEPPPAPAPAEAAPERKAPATRRSHYSRSSSGGGGRVVAVAAILIIGGAIGFVGWQYASKLPPKSAVVSGRPTEKRVGPTLQEASEAYGAFQARVAGAEVNDALVQEASGLADRYGEVYPDFEKLVTELSQKRSEQISKMSFEQVDGLVKAAMDEKRYGAAIDALKALKGSKDASQASALLEQILEKVRGEFKVVDDYGRKMADAKQYTAAADYYRREAPRFRGTEHYRYLANKPENLEMLAEAELAAARAKESKPAVEIAKAEPPKPAMEPPKPAMEPPKPAMEPPKKPAMMEPPKPKPEPPKPVMEPPKPKPEPPKPPPEPPKPAPEPPKPAAEEGPKTAVKKPAVLCEVKRTAKGNYCVKCDRTLGVDDLRKNLCKRCEEKPKKIDLCVKRFFQAECHPEKVDDKPVFC